MTAPEGGRRRRCGPPAKGTRVAGPAPGSTVARGAEMTGGPGSVRDPDIVELSPWVRNRAAYPAVVGDEKALLFHQRVRVRQQTGPMTLRKVSVVITVVCALAAGGAVVGRLWAGGGDPPSLGPGVVVSGSGSDGPLPGPTSRSASATSGPSSSPLSPAASRQSSSPKAPPSEPGGQPVSTPPPHSSDDTSSSPSTTTPTPSSSGSASGGGDDGGDDGNGGGGGDG